MKKREPVQARGEETRAKILHAALALFRRSGLENTTMRDVAERAGVALGAAYYYFPSKEALVLAYYGETQRERAEASSELFARSADTRERLGALMHATLDALSRDRKMLKTLFTSVGDPKDPVSVFSKETRADRDASVALFRTALENEPLGDELRDVAALAFWALHLAFILYFIHDTSRGQEKTRRLVDRTLDLLVRVLPMAPMLAPMASEVRSILVEAGLAEPSARPRET